MMRPPAVHHLQTERIPSRSIHFLRLVPFKANPMIPSSTLLTLFLLPAFVACSTHEPSTKYGGAYVETVILEAEAPLPEVEGVIITTPNGQTLLERRAGSQPKAHTVWSGGLGADIPKYFRVEWRKDAGWDDVPVGDPRKTDQFYRNDLTASERTRLRWSDGTIAVAYNMPVAKRIPSAVSEALRRDPNGTLRIKLRVFPNTKTHPYGVALGWEIQRMAKDMTSGPTYELRGSDFP